MGVAIDCIKWVLLWFIGMNVLAVMINMADPKDKRMPWKRLFVSTWRMCAACLAAGVIILACAFVMFKK